MLPEGTLCCSKRPPRSSSRQGGADIPPHTFSVYGQGFDFGSVNSLRPQESKDFRFSMVDLYKLPERYSGVR